MDLIKVVEQEYLKSDIPAFSTGDTLKVSFKVKEGNRERIQVFEGYVLKSRGTGINKMVTVRKISNGVGVERTFHVNSPKVEKIELVRRGKVRRAKLFYMRELTGKATRIKEKR